VRSPEDDNSEPDIMSTGSSKLDLMNVFNLSLFYCKAHRNISLMTTSPVFEFRTIVLTPYKVNKAENEGNKSLAEDLRVVLTPANHH